MKINDEYDIVVVGGGPAGTSAARVAAQHGVKVALFHRNNEIGVPVRCAEGISREILEKYVGVENIKDPWIAKEVDTFRFVSPSEYNVDVKLKKTGYVLNRRHFDLDLALMAAEAGASIFTGCYVYNVEVKDGHSIIHVNNYGTHFQVKAKLVIAADGVESKIARFFGMDTKIALENIDSCVQFYSANVDIDENIAEFYVSPETIPGGYIWIFPKGPKRANIGIGISGKANSQKSAREYLNEFMNKKFPDASIITNVAGGVPIDKTLANFVCDGLMAVGDAARVANPTTGEGIGPALSTGTRAGKCAASAIKENNTTKEFLQTYEKEWRKDSGKFHNFYFKLKDVSYGLTSAELDKLAQKFTGRDAESISLTEIFRHVLWKKPKLLLDVAKAFSFM